MDKNENIRHEYKSVGYFFIKQNLLTKQNQKK